MEKYKEDFIKFLVKCDALRFGEFKLKSGRIAPHFLNTGMFFDGEKIAKLGGYYAEAIKDHFGDDFDTIYGPAYKGIPLCTAAAIGLNKFGINKGYSFNRKKKKEYGQKDNIIGMPVDENTKIVLIDDVISAGTSIRESIELLKEYGSPKIIGIVISVDRQEKGKTEKNALKEVAENLGISIFSIVNLKEVIEVLYNKEVDGKIYINDEMMDKINKYLEQYGTG